MAKIRRVIHSVERPEPTGFDAQYWPVLIAIAVLFGFLMGTALTLLSGIWLWFSLLAVPVLVLTATIALRFVDDRRLKRSTQLAVIVSLVVHLAMLLSAHHWHMFGDEQSPNDQVTEKANPKRKKSKQIPIVFETQTWQQSQTKITPQPNEEKKVKKREEPQQELEQKEIPTPVDKSQRQVTQNQQQRKQVSQTVPKQAEALSKLSRSNLQAQPKSGSQVSKAKNNSPQNNPDPSQNRPSQLTAKQSTTPQKQNTQRDAPQNRVAETQPRSSTSNPTATAQRRENAEPQPQNRQQVRSSRSRRNTNVANPLSANQVAKSSPSRSKQNPTSQAKSLSPSSTQVTQKTPANRPTRTPQQRAPDSSVAQRETVKETVASRRPVNEPNPKVAQAPTNRPRNVTSPRVPNTTVLEASRNIVQAPRKASQLNPRVTNTNLTRQRNVTSQPTQVQIEAPTQQMSQVTQAATRASRRPNETLPSITPNANPDPTPRRSNNTAPQFASNTTAEAPTPNNSPSQVAQSSGQPRNTTLQKSTEGTAGVGQSQNLLADAPATPKPSLVASDSAVRRSATRSQPADTALQPMQAAQVRRNLADQQSPSSQVKVDSSSPNARIAGSTTPAQLSAHASASKVTAASNASEGRVNAAEGSSSLDTGATKLVSESSTGRASGGGQPDIDQEIRSSSTNRARNGQMANNSLAANLRAEVPTTPSETGGGRPSEVSPDPNATSLAKTVAGDGNQALAGPTSATVAGPTEESSSAPTEAANTVARAAPQDTADGELTPGGGDPNQNDLMRRKRGQLAGANANTKVTFSGDKYTSREEGSEGSDQAPAAQLAGADKASIENQSTGSTGLTGRSNPAGGLAADDGAEKALTEATGGGLARNDKASDEGLNDDGPVASQLAAKGRRGRPAGGGPPANTRVELPAGRIGGAGDGVEGASKASVAGLVGDGVEGLKRRESSGGQKVDLDINQGPGGLGQQMAADTGIRSRRARTDSTSIQLDIDTRFQRKEAGGDPKINTTAVFSKGAFKGRKSGQPGSGGPSTEPAIELGLSWLARQQRAPGNWSLNVNGVSEQESEKVAYDTPTAATGLALLAFQGAGYNHKEYRYADIVNRGVQWLVNNQQDNGDLFVETNDTTNAVCRLYSHGIAAIALCEAYGMTNDPEVRDAAQKALDYISDSQDKVNGGWRYIPGSGSDTSVTGWMVMALKSGKLAGLSVDAKTLELVDRWLEVSADPDIRHTFRYNPNAKNTAQYPNREVKGKTPTSCMTSVGLLLRLYSGWDRNDERMRRGAESLLEQMPGENSLEQRNTYYWYYATQVLKHVGGEPWEKWYEGSLYPLLIRTQQKNGPMEGSWDPLSPVPDRWGYFSGRLYMTTMNLLTLEVKWRLLPLYDETVK